MTGAIGVTGYTGAMGAGTTGVTGVTGVTGFTGVAGGNGGAGATGATGVTGVTGYTGSNGAVGTTGVTGVTGFTGAGTTGVTGVTGFTGPAGSGGAGSGISSSTAAGYFLDNSTFVTGSATGGVYTAVGDVIIGYSSGSTTSFSFGALASSTSYRVEYNVHVTSGSCDGLFIRPNALAVASSCMFATSELTSGNARINNFSEAANFVIFNAYSASGVTTQDDLYGTVDFETAFSSTTNFMVHGEGVSSNNANAHLAHVVGGGRCIEAAGFTLSSVLFSIDTGCGMVYEATLLRKNKNP